jgi:uncharacterized protein YdaU (DUF1376 family)
MANPWSAFYWRDYIGDTGHLSLEQHGAYLLLMAPYYMTGRPLPAHASVLHRVCRCTTDADRSAVDQVLTEFFTLDRDVYRHGRIDRELAKAVDISEKRRAAANAKHHKAGAANAYANAVQVHTQPQPQPQQEKKPSGADAPADSRHTAIREFIKKEQSRIGVPEQWDGRNAKELDERDERS